MTRSIDLPPLGVIAGNRSLPLLFAREIRRSGGRRIVAVAFENETDKELAKWVDEIVWLRVGQLSKLIQAFQKAGVKECVMLGQIAPRNLFDLRPDLRALALLGRLRERNAHALFGAIAEELEKEGIKLIPAIPWLRPLMAPAGFRLGPPPSKELAADLEFGFEIAKKIAGLEIGQTVVVKEGTVLAVEAFEGTDACLRRGGELAGRGGGAVAVKVAKEQHDLRFDIPCIGPTTLETCAKAKIAALGLEAGKNLVLEQERVEELAASKKITVLVCGTA